MRCLVIGKGGNPILQKTIETLLAQGHDVSLFSRWTDSYTPPKNVAHVNGDVDDLPFFKYELLAIKAESIVLFDAFTENDAKCFLEAFWNARAAFTIVSSANVYRAHARLHLTEPGPTDPVPLTESSPLRGKPLHDDTTRDKRFVEKLITDSGKPATILRVPPTYGAGDLKYRLYPLIRRMIDKRDHIPLGELQAAWKWTHGYTDNIAHGIALAATKTSQQRRVYNLGEPATPTLKERTEHLASILNWKGKILLAPDATLAKHLTVSGDLRQHWVYDTTAIRKDLGYQEIVDYYDGLQAAVDWYIENPPAGKADVDYSYSIEQVFIDEAFG